MNDMRRAYEAGASQWAAGPAVVYGRLARLLVEFSPTSLEGSAVLDLGSGTGVGSRAAEAAGARVVAADIALAMLLEERDERPPGVAADALRLPFRDRAFDVVLAPFCMNHLERPESGLREAARVGSLVVASTYASDDDHPVKMAVEQALTDAGWSRPDWYDSLKASMAAWGTVEAATAVIERAGMVAVRVEHILCEFPDLPAEAMVAWRMGMPAAAAFVAALGPDQRAACERRAVALLGPRPEPLVRRVVFLAAA